MSKLVVILFNLIEAPMKMIYDFQECESIWKQDENDDKQKRSRIKKFIKILELILSLPRLATYLRFCFLKSVNSIASSKFFSYLQQ